MIKRKGKLIYYDDKIINMSHAALVEKFPDNTIIITLNTGKLIPFRNLDDCDKTFLMFEKAMLR